VGISILLPSTDFVDERLLVGDVAIEAMCTEILVRFDLMTESNYLS